MDKKEYVYPAVVADGYDGGRLWAANFVGLSGCWVEGETRDDVVRRAPEVLGEYIRCSIAAGMPLPEPPETGELEAADAGEVILVRAVL